MAGFVGFINYRAKLPNAVTSDVVPFFSCDGVGIMHRCQYVQGSLSCHYAHYVVFVPENRHVLEMVVLACDFCVVKLPQAPVLFLRRYSDNVAMFQKIYRMVDKKD